MRERFRWDRYAFLKKVAAAGRIRVDELTNEEKQIARYLIRCNVVFNGWYYVRLTAIHGPAVLARWKEVAEPAEAT